MIVGLVQRYSLEKVVDAIQAESAAAPTQPDRPLRSAEFDRIVGAPLEQPGIVPDAGVQFAAYRIPKHRIDLPKGVRSLMRRPWMTPKPMSGK